MAARSDAATDRISLASAPSMAALTVCGWFKINSASAGSFNTIWRFSLTSGDGTTWILAFRGTNGRTPTLYSPSNTTGIAGAEVALGTYVFLCATLNGTAAQLFYGSEPGGSLTKVTGTVAAGTTDRLTVFGRSPSDASDALLGDAAYMRIWQRVLSDAEVAAESQATSPASSTSIWGNWAFASAALTDSVASRNFTAGSTALSSVADPALSSANNGSGAAVAPAATSAGTAGVRVTGSGGATAPPATAAGTGGTRVTATGTAAASPGIGAGSGAVVVAGTGAATAAPGTSTGAAGALVSAAGGATAAASASTGTGGVLVAGNGAAAAPPATSVGSGGSLAPVEGTGGAIAPAAIAAGTGSVISVIGGDGTAVAPAPSAAGAGQAIVMVTGTAVAPAAHATGSSPLPSSLLLQVGESHAVEWLEHDGADDVPVVLPAAAAPVSWLSSGDSHPA